jgi:hypothetical protein
VTGAKFIAGRDNKGAFAIGAGSTASATFSELKSPDDGVEIEATLIAIREILSELPGVEPKALTRLDEARAEASKPDPDRGEVEQLVMQATRYANNAAGFADAVERLTPPLARIASWLGHTWLQWAPSVGLG